MNEKNHGSIHWSFWVIGGITLLWNVLGSINFLMQMNSDMVAAYRDTERAIIVGRPTWATVAFALAVFGGALGCLLLLLRKSSAYILFIASLLGVIVTMSHSLGIGIDFSLGERIGIIIMPVAVAVFLIWYTKYTQGKGWIS